MNTLSPELAPKLDDSGRWYWPDPECECVRMMRRSGSFRIVLTCWLEEQIAELVDLPADVIHQAENPDSLRNERLSRFRKAAFGLHVEEHSSRHGRAYHGDLARGWGGHISGQHSRERAGTRREGRA